MGDTLAIGLDGTVQEFFVENIFVQAESEH